MFMTESQKLILIWEQRRCRTCRFQRRVDVVAKHRTLPDVLLTSELMMPIRWFASGPSSVKKRPGTSRSRARKRARCA
jgi:hypothetical protein